MSGMDIPPVKPHVLPVATRDRVFLGSSAAVCTLIVVGGGAVLLAIPLFLFTWASVMANEAAFLHGYSMAKMDFIRRIPPVSDEDGIPKDRMTMWMEDEINLAHRFFEERDELLRRRFRR